MNYVFRMNVSLGLLLFCKIIVNVFFTHSFKIGELGFFYFQDLFIEPKYILLDIANSDQSYIHTLYFVFYILIYDITNITVQRDSQRQLGFVWDFSSSYPLSFLPDHDFSFSYPVSFLPDHLLLSCNIFVSVSSLYFIFTVPMREVY